jgi:hypothetical protein
MAPSFAAYAAFAFMSWDMPVIKPKQPASAATAAIPSDRDPRRQLPAIRRRPLKRDNPSGAGTPVRAHRRIRY